MIIQTQDLWIYFFSLVSTVQKCINSHFFFASNVVAGQLGTSGMYHAAVLDSFISQSEDEDETNDFCKQKNVIDST